MKRLFLVTAVLALLCAGVAANAAVTTITFDGKDIVADCTYANPLDQATTPGDGRLGAGDTVIRTYTFGGGPQVDTFNSWLNNMGSGGISEFNLWLQDGTTDQASIWGENLAITNWTAAITGSAPTGWNMVVADAPADWGSAFAGHKIVSFYATDSAYYLRPGIDSTMFSFTADTNAAVGGSYQIWVGSGFATGTGDTNSSGTGGLVNWNVPGSDSVAVDSFQRAIGAQAVPEPMSIFLGIMGLGSVAGFKRLRRK